MAATAVNVIKEGTALKADAALRLHCTMIWGTDCSCRRKASQFGCTERAEFSLGGLPFNIHTTYWNIKSIQLFFRRRRPTKLTGKEAISTLSEGRKEGREGDPLLSLSPLPLTGAHFFPRTDPSITSRTGCHCLKGFVWHNWSRPHFSCLLRFI